MTPDPAADPRPARPPARPGPPTASQPAAPSPPAAPSQPASGPARPAAGSARPVARPALAATLAALWSGVGVLLGTLWLAVPGTYGFDRADERGLSLLGGVPAGAAGAALVALGLAGLAAALAARRTAITRHDAATHRGADARRGTGTRRDAAGERGADARRGTAGARGGAGGRPAVLVVAALNAATFLLVVPDVRALILVGYACALLGPPALLALLAVGAVRGSVSRVAVLVVFVALGLALGLGGGPVLVRLGADVVAGFRANVHIGHLYVLLFLAGGACWAATLVTYAGVRGAGSGGRAGRVATLVAALCPVPYALVRATWLTPWPVLITARELADQPALRVMGLCLGAAAAGGAVLTLGLVRPWGEVFPRWIPVLGGRRVPVAAAVVPGLAVAVLVTAAGPSLVRMSVDTGRYAEALLFPFPVWGPALAAATLAYRSRRLASRATR